MIASSALGMITGILGNIGGKLLEQRTDKINNAHELAKIDAETKAMIAETEASIKITETQIKGEIELAEMASFDISQKAGNTANISSDVIMSMIQSQKGFMRFLGGVLAFLLGIIDVVRTSIRPAITIILMMLTAYMYSESWHIIQKSEVDVIDIIALIEAVNYLTFTVVGWWFGERQLGKKLLSKGK